MPTLRYRPHGQSPTPCSCWPPTRTPASSLAAPTCRSVPHGRPEADRVHRRQAHSRDDRHHGRRRRGAIGAAVPAAVICEHPEVQALWPGLVEAVHLVGSTQIQGRSTVGGNICNGSPAADTTCPLIVNRGRAVIVGPRGRAHVNVEDLFTGPGRTVLGRRSAGGVAAAAAGAAHRRRLSAADSAHRNGHRRGRRRGQRHARCRPASCTAARVAIGAVAPTPLLVPEAGAALVGIAARRRRRWPRRRRPRAPPPTDRRQTRHGRLSPDGGRRADAARGRDRRRRTQRAKEDGTVAKLHIDTTVNGEPAEFLCEPAETLLDVPAQPARADRHQGRLRHRRLRRLLGDPRTAGWCRRAWCSPPKRRADDHDDRRGGAAATRCTRCSSSSSSRRRCSAASARPASSSRPRRCSTAIPIRPKQQVRYWLAGNLCRCTGYDKIVRAVLDAAAEMRRRGA